MWSMIDQQLDRVEISTDHMLMHRFFDSRFPLLLSLSGLAMLAGRMVSQIPMQACQVTLFK